MEAVVFSTIFSIFFSKKEQKSVRSSVFRERAFPALFYKTAFSSVRRSRSWSRIIGGHDHLGRFVFFSPRSGFSNNITKACHNFWALSWCSDIFTASTFPTDDDLTKQNLITFFQILAFISTIRSQLARLGLFLTAIFPHHIMPQPEFEPTAVSRFAPARALEGRSTN